MTSSEGSSSFKIADAYVLVGGRLDDRSVQTAVRQAQQQVSRTPMDLKVNLDKRSLNSAVADTRASVRELSKDMNIKLGVDLDDKSLADTALDVLAAADAMGRDAKVSMRVGLDNATLGKAAVEFKSATGLIGRESQINMRVDSSGLEAADNEVKTFSNHWTRLAKLVAAGAILGSGPIEAVALTGLIGAFGALAIASEASDARVKQSFSDLKAAAKDTAQTGFRDFVPEVQNFADKTTTLVQGLEPTFQRAGLALTPIMDRIGIDLENSIKNGVDASEPILNRLPPLAKALGTSFDTLEKGVVGFENNIDVGRAVGGWNQLAGAVGKVLPSLSLLLNTAAPVAGALTGTLGTALDDVFREASELNPILDGTAHVISAMQGPAGALAPPIIALAVGSKLLTGSWTDVSGAGQKIKGLFTDFPGKLQSVGQAMGFTSAATNAASKEAAGLALNQALLNKEIDQAVVEEATDALMTEQTAKASRELSIAKQQLAASTAEATEAQVAFDAATEESSFAMGPLMVALGVIGAGIALFAGRAKDAAPPAADLTADLKQLADAAPGAAAGVLNNNKQLSDLIDKAKNAGIDVNGMLKAIQGGASPLSAFTQGIQNSANAVGKQSVALGNLATGNRSTNQMLVQTGGTVAGLSKLVNDGTIKWSQLTPQQSKAVTKYNQLNQVIGQLKTTQGDLGSEQQAVNAVTGQSSAQTTMWSNRLDQAKVVAGMFGGTLTGTALQMQNFAAAQKDGTFSLEDYVKAQVSAAGTFQQAVAQRQQLIQAEKDTAAAETQAAQQVDSAHQAQGQAAQQAADAEHSLGEAADSVAQAQHSEEQSVRAVTDARTAERQAQEAERQANKQYIADLAAIRTAEQAVTAARKEAVIELQNEQRQVLDQGDTVADAELRLFDAQQAVIAAGLQNTKLKLSDLANQKNITAQNEQDYQLLLALSQAQHGLNDAKAQQSQLDAQNAADQKAGINGSQGVLAAEQNVAAAQQQSTQQAQQLADSKTAVTKASQQVADAQYAEQQAHNAVAQAQYAEHQAQLAVTQASQAEHQADLSLTTALVGQTAARVSHRSAVAAASTSIDINTVAGNRNVTTLLNLFDSQLAAGKSTDQARAAVEKEGHALGITKGNVDNVINSVTTLGGKTATFGVVGQPSVNLSELINQAEQQGLNPKTLGFTSKQIGNARRDVPTGSSFAQGGLFRGRGGPRDDANVIAVSDKEFIVNADDTSKNLDVLHAINNGMNFAGGFASGGQVGGQVLASNIMLTQVGGMFDAVRNAFSITGTAPNPSVLPTLPKKNPPIPLLSSGFIGDGSVTAGSGLRGSRATNEAIVQRIWASMFGWTGAEWAATVPLLMQESGFNNLAQNPTSTAFGMFQFLNSTWGGYGIPKTSDPTQQAIAGGRYIHARYGDPEGALRHERAFNWYDQGGLLPQGLSIAANNTGASEHKAVFTTDQWNALGALASAARSGQATAPQINHYWNVDRYATASAAAAAASAQTAWDLMMVGKG